MNIDERELRPHLIMPSARNEGLPVLGGRHYYIGAVLVVVKILFYIYIGVKFPSNMDASRSLACTRHVTKHCV